MADAAGFEESVNSFIISKTGEKIYLDLVSEDRIELKPLCKRGSMSLGIFWVHVFQHPNNYPVYSYPYKKLYRAGREYELQLRVDGITVCISLASGLLTVKGRHVIDWFVNRFLGILEGYATPPSQNPKQLKELYSKEELELLQKERERCYHNWLEDWPTVVLEKAAAKVMEAGTKDVHREPIDEEGFLKGEDEETYSPTANLLDQSETKEQLTKLSDGRAIPGNVLYRLWRSTLNTWFSDQHARVYIITPHIDRDRLTDVCMLFLNNKLTASIDTMCVPLSNLYGRFADVRRETIKRFPSKDQVLIEYKIYNSVVYPVIDFLNSFIAMIKDGKAHILQTNTNFDTPSFLTAAAATVSYKEIEEAHFVQAYLDPILV